MSDEQQQDAFSFDGWAIVEMLGHRKRAGRVRTQPIGGTCFLEVKSESANGEPLTEFVNVASLYAFTPCTEEAARLVGKTCNPSPVELLAVPWTVQQAMRRIAREEAAKAAAIEAGEAPEEDERDRVPFDDYDHDDWDGRE